MRGTDVGTGLRRETKTVTFTGASTLGLVNTTTAVFTVTGTVLIGSISGECTVSLASADAATVSLGVTTALAGFIANTTATDLDAGLLWVDATPDTGLIALPAGCKDILITDNVVMRVLTGSISEGALRIDVYWLPISSDGNLVAS